MTFGAWLRWLGVLVKITEPHEGSFVIPQLLPALNKTEYPFDGRRLIGLNLLYQLKNDRDRLSAHGHARHGEWYQTLVDRYAAPLDRLYRELRFLADFPLLRVESIDSLPSHDQQFEYKVRMLMGSDPTSPVQTLNLPVPLQRETIFALSVADGQVLRMHPFLVYRTCAHCRVPHLYQLDSVSDGSVSYNASCDNRIESSECFEDLVQAFPNLIKVGVS